MRKNLSKERPNSKKNSFSANKTRKRKNAKNISKIFITKMSKKPLPTARKNPKCWNLDLVRNHPGNKTHQNILMEKSRRNSPPWPSKIFNITLETLYNSQLLRTISVERINPLPIPLEQSSRSTSKGVCLVVHSKPPQIINFRTLKIL